RYTRSDRPRVRQVVIEAEAEAKIAAVDVQPSADTADGVSQAAEDAVTDAEHDVRLEPSRWNTQTELRVDAVELTGPVRALGDGVIEEGRREARPEREK